jgi:hypothetical protein
MKLKVKCVYDAEIGETRAQRGQRAKRRLDELQLLFEQLRTGSLATKADILAQLSADEELDQIAQRARDGQLGVDFEGRQEYENMGAARDSTSRSSSITQLDQTRASSMTRDSSVYPETTSGSPCRERSPPIKPKWHFLLEGISSVRTPDEVDDLAVSTQPLLFPHHVVSVVTYNPLILAFDRREFSIIF